MELRNGKAPDNKANHRREARTNKPRPDNGSLKSDFSSGTRAGVSLSSRTKAPDSLPPIDKPVSHNGTFSVPSNPRQNPPTTDPAENGIRPNRGLPRRQGSEDLPAQPSNTRASTQPRKPPSRKKKIV